MGYADAADSFDGANISTQSGAHLWTRSMVTVPTNATMLRVHLYNYMASGWVAFDNVYVEPVGTQTVTKYYAPRGLPNGQRIATKKGNEFRYLHGDHLGSTALTTSLDGTNRISQQYYAYGNKRGGGTLNTDQTYTGQKLDSTGLMYYNARYYDPYRGQFISPDTLVPDPTVLIDYNRYAYVRGNPLRHVDDSGHTPWDVVDVGFWAWSANDLYNDPSWANAGWLALDTVGLLPGLPSTGWARRGGNAAQYADEAAEYGKKAVDEASDAVKKWWNPCANSFSADTLVMTAAGLKPIAELAIGDIVLAYTKATGEVGPYPIIDTISHADPEIVLLTIDAETLETTAEHPFYVMEATPWLAEGQQAGRWVDAGELIVGDDIRRADGSTGGVESVQVVPVQQRMYNLTVGTAHTFFVGQQQWLVHNSCNWLGDGAAPKWGTRLAETVDEIYADIPFHPRLHSTMAATVVNGKLFVTSFGDKRAAEFLQQNQEFYGFTYLTNNTDDHAEVFLYNYFSGNVNGIGLSHASGPCGKDKQDCLGFFENIGFENIFWTGDWK